LWCGAKNSINYYMIIHQKCKNVKFMASSAKSVLKTIL
jgi:hypothetical protein